MQIDDWKNGGFGLYLHWPFCQAKCPYCDFNSFVTSQIDEAAWADAFIADIKRQAEGTEDRLLNSVFFGGGTPSLMSEQLVDRVLETVFSIWTPANDCEITLEANPSSVEQSRFEGYRTSGVNRVSLGVQSFDEDHLRHLGRLHSVSEALTAIETAQKCFDRVSFDLIYARQNQTLSDWEKELGRAVSMGTRHLSLYQLTIEPGTAFGDRFARGRLLGLPEQELAADMYFATQSICEDAGLPAYEISNHAISGEESRHNLVYWRSGDYLGVGPGAHGRITNGLERYATDSFLNPSKWLNQAGLEKGGTSSKSIVPNDERVTEYLMMSLRLREGCDLTRVAHWLNEDKENKINWLVDIGMVALNKDILSVTNQGRPVLNTILSELI